MANIAQPDLSVFSRLKTVNDFDRLNQEFEMKKQIAQAQIGAAQAKAAKTAAGGDLPSAIQIVNEMERAKANGDIQRYNLLHQVAKSFAIDRGMTPEWTGPVPTPGMNPMLPALATVESNNNPNAVSPKGAAGTYQIMPDTARQPGFGVKPLQGWDGVDPRTAPQEEQQRFANDYLNAMQSRNGGDPRLAAASYNAGPGRVDAALANLPAETQNYVQKVAPAVIPGYREAASSIEGAKAGAKEKAKLEQQLKLSPDIEAAKSRAKYMEEGFQRLPALQRQLQDVELREQFLQPKFTNIRALASGLTTGFGGALSAAVPGTAAYDLRKEVDTLLANAGFDRLQEMRDNSPTGGALGSVSERELDLLQAAAQNLQASQSQEQFLTNLDLFEQQRQRSLANIRAAYEQDYTRFGGQGDAVLPSPAETKVAPIVAAQPKTNAPSKGANVDGYIFLGGDPSQEKNWKKAK